MVLETTILVLTGIMNVMKLMLFDHG